MRNVFRGSRSAHGFSTFEYFDYTRISRARLDSRGFRYGEIPHIAIWKVAKPRSITLGESIK
jgi:hypothetical protein